jgi:hypothetical protein
VAIENCPLIVRLKVKLILLGVTVHLLQEFENYGRQQPQELSSKDCQQWTRSGLNLGYLVALLEPKVLQMQIFDGFEKPLILKSVMKAYRLTVQQLMPLENYIVTPYNSEVKLSKKGVLKYIEQEGC